MNRAGAHPPKKEDADLIQPSDHAHAAILTFLSSPLAMRRRPKKRGRKPKSKSKSSAAVVEGAQILPPLFSLDPAFGVNGWMDGTVVGC
jgi:hypothetical protein